MSFPLIYFLYIFYGFLVLWFLLCLVVVYHLVTFGFKNSTTFFMTFIFIVISALLILTVFNFINEVNWQTTITIFEGINFNTMPTNY